jgi:hypothetical protein
MLLYTTDLCSTIGCLQVTYGYYVGRLAIFDEDYVSRTHRAVAHQLLLLSRVQRIATI